MIETLTLKEFMESAGTIMDVRSPSEYQQGHIPGALNLPLFTDSERADVGTAYKRQGSEQAISLGLQYVAPKISSFISQAQEQLKGKKAKVHCWRGGMRSAAMAMLLQNMGIPSVTLRGGYKAFRRWANDIFEEPYNYTILGGLTGTGKTSILNALKKQGEQVIDLENIANHRGSVFGNIGLKEQPPTEQVHNEIATTLSTFDPNRPVWIENESRQIGSCHVPEALFEKMLKAPLIVIERPLEERMENLCEEYGNANPQELIEATQRITKKLGGAKAKEVISYISKGKLPEAIEIVLQYYDSAYRHGLSKQNHPIHTLSAKKLSSDAWAQKLLSTRLLRGL